MPTLAMDDLLLHSLAMDDAERYQNSKDETEPLIMPLEWNPQSRSCFSGEGGAANMSNKSAEEGNVAGENK